MMTSVTASTHHLETLLQGVVMHTMDTCRSASALDTLVHSIFTAVRDQSVTTESVAEQVDAFVAEIHGLSAAAGQIAHGADRLLTLAESLPPQQAAELVALARGEHQAASKILYALGRQSATAACLHTLVVEMAAQTRAVAGQADVTERAAIDLHRVVARLTMGVGVVRLEAHDRALAALLRLMTDQGLATTGTTDLEQCLSTAFARYPFFDLLYVMDALGVQITANVVNPRHAQQIARLGRGISRSHRPYWREVIETGHGYVSPIYQSSATQNFCITVSCPLRDAQGRLWAVLAGDVSLGDLLQLG